MCANYDLSSLDQYSEEQKVALVDCCPSRVFGFDPGAGQVIISNAVDCIFCKECIFTTEEFRRSPEDKLVVEVEHSPNKFYFTLETTGSLLAAEVVRDALDILGTKINKLKDALLAIQHTES